MNAAEFRAGCWVGRRGDSAVLWTPEGFGGCDARVFTDRAIEVPWADLGMIGEGRWRLVKDVVHERFSTGSGRAAHLGVDWVVDTVGSRLPDHAHTQRSSSGSASESCRITVIPAWRGHLLCFSCDGTVCVGCVARRHLATQPALVASTRLRPDATLLDTLDRIEAKDAARFADQVDRVLVTSRIGSAAPGGVWFLGRDGGIRPVTWLRRPECGWACAEAGAERTLEDLVDPDCGIVTRVVSSRVSEHLWQSAAHGSSTLEGLAPGAVAELSRGVDPDPAAARIKALAEAGERYALVASATGVDEVPPESAPRWTLDEFWPAAQASGDWAAATALDGRTVAVPREVVSRSGDRGVQVTSNGVAAHESRELATEAAVLELLERDAVLHRWVHAGPATDIDLNAQCRELTSALGGWRFGAKRLSSRAGLPVVLVGATSANPKTPGLVLGAACRVDVDEAAIHALREVTGNIRGRPEPQCATPAPAPQDVLGIDDHDAYFRDRERVAAATWFWGRGTLGVAGDGVGVKPSTAVASSGVQACRERGIRVAVVDLTPPDLRSCGLVVVRAVSPDLLPLWFGYRREPAGHPRLAGATLPIEPHPFV